MVLFGSSKGRSDSSSEPKSPSTFPYRIEANCSQCGSRNVTYDLRDSTPYLDRIQDIKNGLIKLWENRGHLFDFLQPLKKVRDETRELDHSLNVILYSCEHVLDELNDPQMCPRAKNLIGKMTDMRDLLRVHKSCIPSQLAALETSQFDKEMGIVEANGERVGRLWPRTTEGPSQPRA